MGFFLEQKMDERITLANAKLVFITNGSFVPCCSMLFGFPVLVETIIAEDCCCFPPWRQVHQLSTYAWIVQVSRLVHDSLLLSLSRMPFVAVLRFLTRFFGSLWFQQKLEEKTEDERELMQRALLSNDKLQLDSDRIKTCIEPGPFTVSFPIKNGVFP